MITIDELLTRWNAPMEGFFKPVYRISLALLALCAGLVFANSTLIEYQINVPAWLTVASGIAGAVGAAVSKLTIDRDKLKLKQKVELATKYRVSALKSAWWVSALSLFVDSGAYFGWFVMALLLTTTAYRPVAWLLHRYLTQRETEYARRSRERAVRLADLTYLLENWPTDNHG